MWKHILNFELRLGLKKTSVIVYFLVFFGLAFLIVNILGGAFTGARIIVGNANNNLNAPMVIAMLQNMFCIIGVLVCAAIFGMPATAILNLIPIHCFSQNRLNLQIIISADSQAHLS